MTSKTEQKRILRLARIEELKPLVAEKEEILRAARVEYRTVQDELCFLIHREQYYEKHPPKPPKTKPESKTSYTDERKKSQRKKMTGREHSPETIEKMQKSHTKQSYVPRAIMTPSGEFETINSAARYFGMTPGGLFQKLKRPNDKWYYLDRPSTANAIQTTPAANAIKVMSPTGVEYSSLRNASLAEGITLYHLNKSIVNGTGWKLI